MWQRLDQRPAGAAHGYRTRSLTEFDTDASQLNGSPWENGYIESFTSRFRDELLDRELFLGSEDARWVVDRWRLDDNHHRPHSSLDDQTPAEFAARCSASAPQVLSATPQSPAPLQWNSGPLTPDSLMQAGTLIGGSPHATART
ncbi:MAG: hypothetical protein CMJ58_23710 [Planctomycetaceae bacterium]|nr:hypothetical protein [Planctomycetaceae bacterium]